MAGKNQDKKRFSVGVCAPHRLSRGLVLNVCVVQCIKLFQCMEIGIFFSSIFGKKKVTSISSHWISSYRIALNVLGSAVFPPSPLLCCLSSLSVCLQGWALLLITCTWPSPHLLCICSNSQSHSAAFKLGLSLHSLPVHHWSLVVTVQPVLRSLPVILSCLFFVCFVPHLDFFCLASSPATSTAALSLRPAQPCPRLPLFVHLRFTVYTSTGVTRRHLILTVPAPPLQHQGLLAFFFLLHSALKHNLNKKWVQYVSCWRWGERTHGAELSQLLLLKCGG